jgi:hypothetical protein
MDLGFRWGSCGKSGSIAISSSAIFNAPDGPGWFCSIQCEIGLDPSNLGLEGAFDDVDSPLGRLPKSRLRCRVTGAAQMSCVATCRASRDTIATWRHGYTFEHSCREGREERRGLGSLSFGPSQGMCRACFRRRKRTALSVRRWDLRRTEQKRRPRSSAIEKGLRTG